MLILVFNARTNPGHLKQFGLDGGKGDPGQPGATEYLASQRVHEHIGRRLQQQSKLVGQESRTQAGSECRQDLWSLMYSSIFPRLQ